MPMYYNWDVWGILFSGCCLCIVDCSEPLARYLPYFYREGILALTMLLLSVISE